MERRSLAFLFVLILLVLAAAPQLHALWIEGGVALRNTTGHVAVTRIISDGSNGAIVVWNDGRNGIGNNDIYVQKVDASGNVRWTTAGVAITAAAEH